MKHRRVLVLTIVLGVAFIPATVFSKQVKDSATNKPLKAEDSRIFIMELSSLSVSFREAERKMQDASREKAASVWQDVEVLFSAVVGERKRKFYSYEDLKKAYTGEAKIAVPLSHALLERDKLAYKLNMLGYSAKEISDVLERKISVNVLDNARKMRLLGRSEKEVSDYLDSRYKQIAGIKKELFTPKRKWRRPSSKLASVPAIFDSHVLKYAERHGLDPDIVRAIIRTESNWNQAAISPKGAIGLMQLMPGTARLLRVNPHDPEENIEGGTRYFSFLLNVFKSLDLALIAYNAGPAYAERYAQGKVFLYGETRAYIQSIKSYLTGWKGQQAP